MEFLILNCNRLMFIIFLDHHPYEQEKCQHIGTYNIKSVAKADVSLPSTLV
jgi:hypothetical protein